MRKIMLAGLLAGMAMGAAGAAAYQADPWTTAAYDIGIKKNADALRLIDSGQFDVNFQTDEGYTLLHRAADAGNLEIVKALLARGADPNLKSALGRTAYDMASGVAVKAELARAMHAPATASRGALPGADRAAAGAGAGNGSCAAVVAEKVNNGRTPAMRPILRARDDIWYNHPDELALLLDDCVDANGKDDTGATLLHTAASRNRVDAAKLLLAHGASRSARDRSGNVPANYATSPEMKALLGAASAPVASSGPAGTASEARKKECAQKYQADAALCSDSSCKMRANSHWAQCLKTGRYW
ncbi:ankyrin repeat protein [Sphingomonas naasensis]|uniref:Ankyrin repeat domain-containing protein n=1 Tax=Sphingomonas naasensis TaxID=1344951 RepID=A0A4S1WR97_9SPHN|nr:ankyrin repeat domain-containing protein [Sphingomonas naasensis]NIJ18640.1 ankyrin repeat protein [Sphingomonas naasensis]TGX45884.1 ankyrin repeat domain-containing protein [Sphingomonas naasensis]